MKVIKIKKPYFFTTALDIREFVTRNVEVTDKEQLIIT